MTIFLQRIVIVLVKVTLFSQAIFTCPNCRWEAFQIQPTCIHTFSDILHPLFIPKFPPFTVHIIRIPARFPYRGRQPGCPFPMGPTAFRRSTTSCLRKQAMWASLRVEKDYASSRANEGLFTLVLLFYFSFLLVFSLEV